MGFDVAIIGGGIAGASAAAHIAPGASVVLIEQESQPGYHATGRSAALFSEIYGNATVRALSRASRAFLEQPPAGFAAAPILTPRGALHVGGSADIGILDHSFATAHRLVASVKRLGADDVRAMVPVLRREAVAGGVFEPDACDIDTNGLLQGFLRRLRAGGGEILLDAPVTAIQRERDSWRITAGTRQLRAATIVNAAGAWGDQVAAMAGAAQVGLAPKRRTAFLIRPPHGFATGAWPLVIGAREDLYFKPDAGMLLVSPADETASAPVDAQPEEIDIAVAVDRLAALTTIEVRRIEHKWAGLRTFTADKTPVVGFDPERAGFFWLVGQGGYGFQTAPALGRLAAALLRGGVPSDLEDQGITAAALAPARLNAAAAPERAAESR